MKFALLGKHIDYSLSPQIHHWLFKKYGVNASYELLSTEDPTKAIGLLKKGEYQGFNVTIPYKQKFGHCALSDIAKHCQACNVLGIKNGTVWADNTDGFGFLHTLEHAKISDIRCAVIAGTGGVAKSIAYALKTKGIEACFLTRQKSLIDHKTFFPYNDFTIGEKSLLVNATPLGMPPFTSTLPLPKEILKKFHAIMDTAYSLKGTVLEHFCKENSLPCANGLVMLIAQAIKAQCIWFDRTFEDNVDPILNVLGGNDEDIGD